MNQDKSTEILFNICDSNQASFKASFRINEALTKPIEKKKGKVLYSKGLKKFRQSSNGKICMSSALVNTNTLNNINSKNINEINLTRYNDKKYEELLNISPKKKKKISFQKSMLINRVSNHLSKFNRPKSFRPLLLTEHIPNYYTNTTNHNFIYSKNKNRNDIKSRTFYHEISIENPNSIRIPRLKEKNLILVNNGILNKLELQNQIKSQEKNKIKNNKYGNVKSLYLRKIEEAVNNMRMANGFNYNTLSNIFKVDHNYHNVDSKYKLSDECINLHHFRHNSNMNVNNFEVDNNQPSLKKDILSNLINVLTTSNTFGVDKLGKKNENYLVQLNRDIKKSIKKNELIVKDTMDSLYRLQRDNDENLNRISFIKKLVFK